MNRVPSLPPLVENLGDNLEFKRRQISFLPPLYE